MWTFIAANQSLWFVARYALMERQLKQKQLMEQLLAITEFIRKVVKPALTV